MKYLIVISFAFLSLQSFGATIKCEGQDSVAIRSRLSSLNTSKVLKEAGVSFSNVWELMAKDIDGNERCSQNTNNTVRNYLLTSACIQDPLVSRGLVLKDFKSTKEYRVALYEVEEMILLQKQLESYETSLSNECGTNSRNYLDIINENKNLVGVMRATRHLK